MNMKVVTEYLRNPSEAPSTENLIAKNKDLGTCPNRYFQIVETCR